MRHWCRSVAIGVIVLLALASAPVSPASAVSLRVTPLKYQTTLKSGEKQTGHVDISNPEADTVDVAFEVQAFRQTNNEGSIEFYDDEAVSAGVLLDLKTVELGPHEVLRLMFQVDGTRLPQGEVFAAILAHTVPHDAQGSAQAVRVGTILEITNGTPGAHKASVDELTAPFLQIGDGISATFVVRNDDLTTQTTGFHPPVTVRVSPYAKREVVGPLVFAGHSRTVAYKDPGNYFGFVRMQVSTSDSSKEQLVFAMTGYWRWLGPLMFVSVILLIAMAMYMRRKKH